MAKTVDQLFSRVKYVPHDDLPYKGGEVFVNGTKIESVRSLKYDHGAGTIPMVTLELNATYEIDELVKLNVTVPNETTEDALRCISLVRQLDRDFEKKLVDRIYSALIDTRTEENSAERASEILDYILEDY